MAKKYIASVSFGKEMKKKRRIKYVFILYVVND